VLNELARQYGSDMVARLAVGIHEETRLAEVREVMKGDDGQ